MKVYAVIGGGYGDESKGKKVDYWANLSTRPVVIRSNGGAQAGHTVVTPTGERHVFSHIGAGTFANAPTYLSNHFVLNPVLFKKEHEEFITKFGFAPEIYADSSCKVTSVFDMLINQSFETMRGDNPHGSCGVGFGETLERYKYSDKYHMNLGHNLRTVKKKLEMIRDDYLPRRLKLSQVSETFLSVLYSDILIEEYLEAFKYMNDHIETLKMSFFADKTLIFEGAQGLGLDQDYGDFPYVTRSNTGMKNVADVLRRIAPKNSISVTVDYLTRAYSTRHGAGPLAFEKPNPDWMIDKTNITNEWQGEFRYAPLNLDRFNSLTDRDFALYGRRYVGDWELMRVNTLSHINQIPKKGLFITIENGEKVRWTPSQYFDNIAPFQFNFISDGFTRLDVNRVR